MSITAVLLGGVAITSVILIAPYKRLCPYTPDGGLYRYDYEGLFKGFVTDLPVDVD